MTEYEHPVYRQSTGALSLLCALLLAVAAACLAAGCAPRVRYVRLPPPLTDGVRCSDPVAQCMTKEGVCREVRRGACR